MIYFGSAPSEPTAHIGNRLFSDSSASNTRVKIQMVIRLGEWNERDYNAALLVVLPENPAGR
jgi:hypothetical protein